MNDRKTEKTVAVFFDADNFPYNMVGGVMRNLKSVGDIVMMRAYGNFSKPLLKPWLSCTKDYAIKQVQHVDYIPKKNSSDISLIIDCLETAFTNSCDIFVIVSCDSDFTPLAIKLREMHKTVIGFANRQLAEAYIHACNKVVIFSESSEITTPLDKLCQNKVDLDYLLKVICKEHGGKDGFVSLSAAGAYVKKIIPDIKYNEFSSEAKSLGGYLKGKPELYRVEVIGATNCFCVVSQKKAMRP